MPSRSRPRLARRSRLRGVLVAVAGGCLWLVSTAVPASAHAQLLSTSPGQGSQVSTAPAFVVLHFGEGVGINSTSVQVLDPQGRQVQSGVAGQVAGDSASVSVALPTTLPRASYTVIWHVVSADSHPVQGTFSFGVGVPAGAAQPAVAGDPAVHLLDGLVRFATLVGAALLVGGTVFLLLLWPSGLTVRRARRLLIVGWAVSLAGTVALLGLQGPYGEDSALTGVVDPGLLNQTLSSQYGKMMLLRIGVLIAVAIIWRRNSARWPPAPGERGNLAGLGLLFLVSFSLSEHAGQGSVVPLTATVDALHLLAAAVWLGGLAMLAACLLRADRPPAAGPGTLALNEAPAVLDPAFNGILRGWSRLAMIAVASLAVTGAVQAWREVGAWGALPGTAYGRLVLLKITGFGALLLLGDQGRRWVVRRRTSAASPAHVRALRRSVSAELGIGVGVLALTAALVNSVPGRDSYAPPYAAALAATGVDGTQLRARVRVDPTRVGGQSVEVRLTDDTGTAVPFTNATGSLTDRAAGLGPVTFVLQLTGTGTATGRVVVPAAGQWTLTLEIFTGRSTAYATTGTYRVT